MDKEEFAKIAAQMLAALITSPAGREYAEALAGQVPDFATVRVEREWLVEEAAELAKDLCTACGADLPE